MKQRFIVTIDTDGLDYPHDMHGIAEALCAAIPDVVRPFVRETAPAVVLWEPPPNIKPKKKRQSKRKRS